LKQGSQSTTNSTHMWCWVWELNPRSQCWISFFKWVFFGKDWRTCCCFYNHPFQCHLLIMAYSKYINTCLHRDVPSSHNSQ
jgi:hypothetical protein